MAPPYQINDWQQAAAEKRQALQSSIPASHRLPPHLQAKANEDELLPSSREILESGLLSPLEIEITDIDDAAVLVDRIATRTYTAVQVTEAFCKRASIAQQTTNCLTEIMYSQALARAQSLDEYQAKEGKTMGILHGLPVSLKVWGYLSCHPKLQC
jgi:amidase